MSRSAPTVIDAQGLILGRMASTIAKRLLNGERIEIVNAESAVISGKRLQVINEAKEFLGVRGPRWGPIHYRRPNMIVRRTIRGMLPYKSAHGIQAYRRLRVHVGVPNELVNAEKQIIPDASVERLGGHYVTVGEVAESIGWKR